MVKTGKKYGYVFAGVAAAALAVTMVLAGQHGRQSTDQAGDPHGPGFGHGVFGMEDGHLVHVLSKLNLTDDQKTQLKNTLLADGPTMEPLIEASMQAHKALGEVMHSQTFDANAVKAAADALGAAESNLAVERARLFSSVQTTILTDAQKQTLQTMKQNMQQHMQQRADQNAGQPRNFWADHVNALIGQL
jgi:Spy/CpxP family protein refolding chaperone